MPTPRFQGAIIAGSRARLTVTYKHQVVDTTLNKINRELFDPALISFSSWFTPKTRGLPTVQTTHAPGSESIVRQMLGTYYVEVLLEEAGQLKYTWRSLAEGQQSIVEYTLDVLPREVLESAG